MTDNKTLSDVIDDQVQHRREIRRRIQEAADNLNLARAELRAEQNRRPRPSL